ncbi:MAG: LapA family protein [Burkholderiales bacterium]|nr:LapA family protein [Burkholderiales bacterium]
MRAARLVINIVLFLLVLVLCINNSQIVTINLYGMYTLNVPLILALAILATIGFIIGILFNIPRNIKAKSQISKLEKELAKYTQKTSITDKTN